MPNPFSRDGVSDADIQRALRESVEVDASLRQECQKVAEYWKSVSPVDDGDYAASVKVLEVRGGKGKVGTKHWKAHMIEHGTGPDTKEGSPFGKNTPTPEFAPAAKTAAHFGGDMIGGDRA